MKDLKISQGMLPLKRLNICKIIIGLAGKVLEPAPVRRPLRPTLLEMMKRLLKDIAFAALL